jgi:uncharacterized protein (DUF2267 family)
MRGSSRGGGGARAVPEGGPAMSQTGLEVFDSTIHQTNAWLKSINEELGWGDRHLAYHALRSTLQTLRDRVPPDVAAKLSGHLPLLVRGIYYEGYTPSSTPVRLRTQEEFLEAVHERYGHREPIAVDEMVTAVFRTLNAHVTPELLVKVRQALGEDLTELWPEPATT